MYCSSSKRNPVQFIRPENPLQLQFWNIYEFMIFFYDTFEPTANNLKIPFLDFVR